MSLGRDAKSTVRLALDDHLNFEVRIKVMSKGQGDWTSRHVFLGKVNRNRDSLLNYADERGRAFQYAR